MFFKKIAFSLLVFVFMVSTIGVVIHKHYSGKQLYAKSILTEAKSCCEESCNCCHNISVLIQLKENFLPSYFQLKKIANIDIPWNPVINVSASKLAASTKKTAYIWDSSPPPLIPDLCILHQVFRL